MKKTRRDISKELMYSKIMPTNHARKSINDIQSEQNNSDLYLTVISEDNNTETSSEIIVKQPVDTENDDSVNDNDSIVKILSEYNEYKDKKNSAGENDDDDDDNSDDKKENIPENKNKENNKPDMPKSSVCRLVNIKEIMINNKIDEVLDKFNCCKCDSCKLEITAIALNRLTPQYIICHNEKEIEETIPHSEYSKITSALINAIITLRANPVHK